MTDWHSPAAPYIEEQRASVRAAAYDMFDALMTISTMYEGRALEDARITALLACGRALGFLEPKVAKEEGMRRSYFKGGWTPEARAAAAERMRQRWAEGKMVGAKRKPSKENNDAL